MMKIGQRLILGFVGTALLVGFVGGLCIFQTKISQNIAEKEIYRSIEYLDDTWTLMEAQEHMEIAAMDYLFLDVGLDERRADYFFEKDRLEEVYQKYHSESCKYVRPLLEKYYENMKIYDTKIEEAFELHKENTDSEALKEKIKEANKYVEIAHEDALEPIIKHVQKDHIEPARKNIANAINRTTVIIIIISFVSVLLAIGLGLFLSHSICLPINKLERATAEIARGNLDIKAEIESSDEIGHLAASFNQMAQDLQKSKKEIEDYSKNLEEKVEERTKELKATNEELELTNEELSQTNEELESTTEELRRQSESVAKANAHAAELMVELEEVNNDLKIEIERRKLAEEKLQHAHDELEVKVKERTAELATTVERLTIANRELKEFAYIAAHDLKSPVRAIGSLAGMISNECRDVLSEQCKEELDMLVQRTERMYAFIDGILEYATLGHVAKRNEKIDINDVINWVINQVKTQNEAIEITIEKDLPIIMGQRAHITQIFQNLLDNAVKFMDKPNGQIRIDYVEKDDFWEFSVSDNGPGIEEKYFDKIFQIFQTLTRRDEIEAAGIGLALVRKIVELYGGKIWLKSETGEGSTFFFTLSKQETGVKNEESYAYIIS